MIARRWTCSASPTKACGVMKMVQLKFVGRSNGEPFDPTARRGRVDSARPPSHVTSPLPLSDWCIKTTIATAVTIATPTGVEIRGMAPEWTSPYGSQHDLTDLGPLKVSAGAVGTGLQTVTRHCDTPLN
mmetsp:Transcript_25304/g.76194  ORF Transcript_25304/g.76194 Transcript_25304/m.76194 type:complete len:129 (+) Transcript_25304:2075-2461(+)